MADVESLAELVRAHRRRLGLSQEGLAERAEVSVRTVRNIEGGRSGSPRRRSVRAIADALGLDGAARAALAAAASIVDATDVAGPAYQLPPDVWDFTGRDAVAAQLVESLGTPLAGPVPVALVAGCPGVGKTALAVHVAHRLRDRFPGGQLFIRLQSGDGAPRTAADVLGQLLRSLGVEGARMPAQLEERAALYRSRLADRRVLVLLDDASDAAQIRPLLPGTSGSAALLTSRTLLAGLDGVEVTGLDVLDRPRAVELLGRIAGADRVQAEVDDAGAIVDYCGRLPLAVRIAGARLAARPRRPLRWLATLLADERRRLDELVVGELAVRASVNLSYRALPRTDRAAFRRLALADMPDFAAWLVAAVLDAPLPVAEAVAERLVDAHLLDVANDSGPATRYRFHDLVRLFARERAEVDDEPSARATTLDRVFGAVLHLLDEAGQALPHEHPPMDRCAASRWSHPTVRPWPRGGSPTAWLETERDGLVRLLEQACSAGALEHAWGMISSLLPFLDMRQHLDDLGRVSRSLLGASLARGDTRAEAYGHWAMGELYAAGSRAAALQEVVEARRMFRELGHHRSEGSALSTMTSLHRVLGHPDLAAASGEEMLGIAREVGDERLLALAEHDLGVLAADAGDLDGARRRFEAAVGLCVVSGNERAESLVRLRLGTLSIQARRHDESMRHLSRSLALGRRLGDRVAEAYALLAMHDAYQRVGRDDRAAEALRRSLALFREVRHPLGEARALLARARIEGVRGDRLAAELTLREALRRVEPTGVQQCVAAILEELQGLGARARRSSE
jgi:transcriptional regulator with XRE-family HTH domain/tetratricopeptide (TPR) repeat protein